MSLNFSSVGELINYIKEEEVEFIDFRFTDNKSKWHHLPMVAPILSEDDFEDGFLFDGSSIAGWKTIDKSDMSLIPDVSTAMIDPFSTRNTLIVFCSVIEPSSGQPYERDARSVAKKAEAYLQNTGLGDNAYFGAEPEFFMFDDVRFKTTTNQSSYFLDTIEGPWNNDEEYETGNLGHRPTHKGGYFPSGPIDPDNEIRAEMTSVLIGMGLKMDKHHHEVAPAQHELGLMFNSLVRAADDVQVYKYGVQMIAASYGKSATFMPKPIYQDNGSGLHVHQSIWSDGKPLFAGAGYADLSDMALYYIGGIIKHAKALNAFTNPSTNSYKRLVPGFEAPVLLAYSASNRSASCRIPYSNSPKGKRVEIRFPDPTANPYLAFSAMLMAGIDGIQNKIHPGDAMDKNLYDLPPEELKDIPTVCASLDEALWALDQDRDFLKKGDVFSDDLIDSYIELKLEEAQKVNMAPHPLEFELYYSS